MTLPPNVQLLAPKEDLDFFHSASIALAEPMTAIEAWNRLIAHPPPFMTTAFRIRDAISSRFGVRRIGGFTRTRHETPKVGDRLDFFLVEYASDTVLALSERDRHLDVMTCISTHADMLTVTASVKTHNLFGRLYMIPVAPAHRVIVATMLKSFQREQQQRQNGSSAQ